MVNIDTVQLVQTPVTPNQPIQSTISTQATPVALNVNAIWRRIFAALFEIILWAIIMGITSYFFGSKDVLTTSSTTTNTAGQIVNSGKNVTYTSNLTGFPALILFLVAGLYFIILEWRMGGSIGKLLFGLKVVNESGGGISLMQSIIRNLLRIVDGIFFVGLLILATNDKKQRLGDKLAHTLVIRP